jgi:transposase-like protein
MNNTGPQTLLEAVRTFSDLDACQAYMVALKWPDGKITCPKCGGENVGLIASRRMLQCRNKECRKQFSAKVGTIFEDSPLGLDKWFVAVWCVANDKNGISSCELARALGVTQKTAWFMLHRIRLAMRTNTFRKLAGIVESDETFIGGKAENMHAAKRAKKILGRGAVGKAIVHGLLERGGEVRASVVRNTTESTLVPEIVRNVDSTAVVCTDAAASYANLYTRFIHKAIDHAKGYVAGQVHVNGIENFWSLLKRALRGTYVAVAPFHLFRYVDEEVFRFNGRHGNDASRFHSVMGRVVGQRLTFRELCAIDDAGFMGLT